MEEKREPLSQMAIEKRIQLLRNKNVDNEVIALVKSDYEDGLTDDEVNLYLDKNYDLNQMKVLSNCLHKGVSEEMMTLLRESKMAGGQMQTALNYYEKGVPVAAIKEVVEKDDTAINMRRMLDVVLENLSKAKEQKPEDSKYVKALVAQMEKVVEKINHQNERYDVLNKKLSEIETSKDDEEVRERLVKDNQEKEELINRMFNSMTFGNELKPAYNFDASSENLFKVDFAAEEMLEWAKENNMKVRGHVLVWHSQVDPSIFAIDYQAYADGKLTKSDTAKLDEECLVDREELLARLKRYIYGVLEYTYKNGYADVIYAWDVVNEAIEDNGAYRKTKFYEILGEEYIPLAFQYAHEADPDAELYYNDYSMAQPGRREAVVKMVNDLKKRGIRIDAIGMQGHIGMDYPKISEFEKSMLAFAGTGVKIMITELDLTVIPSPNPNVGAEVTASFEYKKEMNPYSDGLPEEVSKAWTERMNDFFRLFLKHHNLITRVTLWGVADQNSWRNDWPMRGRTDYPLLFDRNYQPKPVVGLIIKEAEKTK